MTFLNAEDIKRLNAEMTASLAKKRLAQVRDVVISCRGGNSAAVFSAAVAKAPLFFSTNSEKRQPRCF